MAIETELKLRLSPDEAARFGRHSLLAEVKPRRVRLQNTYYDTADDALRQRGIALRLRRKDRAEWLVTVKGRESGVAGLAQRREWEAPTRPGVLDFSHVADEALRSFLEALKPQLKAAFATDFMRTWWRLSHAGGLIEIALDQGEIRPLTPDGKADRRASAAIEPICEVELELVEGASTDALFELAIALAGDLHLHPEIRSKAERGYLLVRPELARPFKAATSPVAESQEPVEAFVAIALGCLEHLQRNEAGAVAGADDEYVHQARIALRRLRSALSLFAPVLRPAFVEVYSPRWREVSNALGGARDWDVFLGETLPPLEDAFPGDSDLARLRAYGNEKRGQGRAAAIEVLTGRDYAQLMLAFSAALLRAEPPTIALADADSRRLRSFARRQLDKRLGVVERRARRRSKVKSRHRLRIALKKLRYAIDFFAPLFPGKRLPVYLRSLATVQDFLGASNDQEIASQLIGKMRPKRAPKAATLAWIARRRKLLVEPLDAEVDALLASRKPWRKSAIV